ncbi:hypothetical protein [Actinokineospora globicatena]|uniref:hypothetical protein n=1 Tax=Actinokineospora globicatena TaxID=103729 RepID=UPI0020A39B11|nr:hypothetical protein [Actinokineospora globicatena]MCP2303134.1 hypothetical protein [Actinokineospora globicatena]GLW79752.1 hypothetical protein Aglo01_42330 [Actinokineospora globicatena]GLW85838.1 hypothetical protein Aglo02_34780 [Actinokineospora globicatena]
MPDEVVDASPARVVAVIEQMADLPWPDGDEWLEWEIDGLAGQTSYLMHVLPLGATSDAAALAALTSPLRTLADQRWGARHRFDATRFTDDAGSTKYDRRSAPASLVRALDSDSATWWRSGSDAVVLIDNSAAAPKASKAAVLVLPARWLAGPGDEEKALHSPVVADLLSGDKDRVLSGVWAVIKTRDPEILTPLARALPAIRKATANADLGGALASNGSHLDHALHRIELFTNGTCLCAAYLSHQFYDPAKEEVQDHIRIVATVPNDGQWIPDRICECHDCGHQFQVEQGEYHYTWWKWTEHPPGGPPPRNRKRGGAKS